MTELCRYPWLAGVTLAINNFLETLSTFYDISQMRDKLEC